MGCRPSRNSLGRIADSTSEYNRCYIKELDKARRKQKKSTRGGRRRAPTYNTFSSTTKCYERDKGASKITVRLSTDGSMLEIEQYDIEYSPQDDFVSESAGEDRGIEMKPAGGESTSFDRLLKKKFTYGRSDSAPLLLTDSIIPHSSRAAGYNGGTRGSNSSIYSEDSINGATPHAVTDNVSSTVAVTVHKQVPENNSCREGRNSECGNAGSVGKNSVSSHIGVEKQPTDLNGLCVGLDDNDQHEVTESLPEIYTNNDLSGHGDRQKISLKRPRIKKLIPDCQKCYAGHAVIPNVHTCKTGDFQSCACGNDYFCTEEHLIKNVNNMCEKCAKIHAWCREDGRVGHENCEGENKILPERSVNKLLGRKDPCSIEIGLSQVNSCLLVESKSDNIINVHGNAGNCEYKINERQDLTENHNASDRFVSHCFVCEKDKWSNTEPPCAYINNKCHSFVSPGLRDCRTDSNANVCCCRRHASESHRKSSRVSNLPTELNHATNFDETYKKGVHEKCKTVFQDDKTVEKMSVTDLTVECSSKLRIPHETNRTHPRTDANPITRDIDFTEKKLCHALLGQQTFTPNEPVAVFSDSVQGLQCSEKSMCAHRQNEHLENLLTENMKNYICVAPPCSSRETTEIKIDKFKSVTMVTNDVSETTLRDDEKLRCYHHVSTMEEFSRHGGIHNCINESIDNADDDIYHDACSCQRCTYFTTKSQSYRYTGTNTGSSNYTSKNNERNQSICKIDCCDSDDVIRDDIWRYKHIDMENYADDNDGYDIDYSDSSDDYRDDEYVDAMETTYV